MVSQGGPCIPRQVSSQEEGQKEEEEVTRGWGQGREEVLG